MRILLSGNLRRFTEYESELEFDATSIPSALEQLVERYPDLRPVLYDGENQLRTLHRLHLNGEIISTQVMQTAELSADDELGIITALAGG